MTIYLYIDLFLFLLFEIGAKICCRDAINYNRNKSKQKRFYKEHNLIIHLFRLYTPSMSYAPHHLLWFQIFRLVNGGLLVTGIVLLIADLEFAYKCFFYMKIVVLYLPAVLWSVYVFVTQIGREKGKQINFDYFKRP